MMKHNCSCCAVVGFIESLKCRLVVVAVCDLCRFFIFAWGRRFRHVWMRFSGEGKESAVLVDEHGISLVGTLEKYAGVTDREILSMIGAVSEFCHDESREEGGTVPASGFKTSCI